MANSWRAQRASRARELSDIHIQVQVEKNTVFNNAPLKMYTKFEFSCKSIRWKRGVIRVGKEEEEDM